MEEMYQCEYLGCGTFVMLIRWHAKRGRHRISGEIERLRQDLIF